MTLFDAYLMVDWSAAARPKEREGSIWIALVVRTPRGPRLRVLENPPTRQQAHRRLGDLLADLLAEGRRVLAGFDFPFGYPEGTACALGLKDPPWRALWKHLATEVADGADNANNRFEVANQMNMRMPGTKGPFWGHPPGHGPFRHLGPKRPQAHEAWPAEKRACERRVPTAQPVWKLFGRGSVGGQALTGIPVLDSLRHDRRLVESCRVWPFETGLRPLAGDDTGRRVVLAEIYPSLVRPDPARGGVKDALQVQAIAGHLARLDEDGALAALFAGAPELGDGERRHVEQEEGWILGVGRPDLWASGVKVDVDGLFAGQHAHVDEPGAIYRRSRRIIENEADLSRLPADRRELALRLIHACGMIDLAGDIAVSKRALERGRRALAAGKPVVVDVEMVARGIAARRLPAANRVLCKVASEAAARRAERLGMTRSAAAIDLLAGDIAGAVVAIGNAPTALYRLLEIVAAGAEPPALVIGMPVGFVGAAESKRALADSGLEHIVVHGRRGGSALAAAAVNALVADLP